MIDIVAPITICLYEFIYGMGSSLWKDATGKPMYFKIGFLICCSVFIPVTVFCKYFSESRILKNNDEDFSMMIVELLVWMALSAFLFTVVF